MEQARQFIVHEHISLGNKTVTSPSYLVPVEEEATIKFAINSSLADVNHPLRAAKAEKEQKQEKAKEDRRKAKEERDAKSKRDSEAKAEKPKEEAQPKANVKAKNAGKEKTAQKSEDKATKTNKADTHSAGKDEKIEVEAKA